MVKYQRISLFLLPVLISFLLHFRVLKLDVMGYHVWRQAQTQTVVYHFNFSDNNIFHPQKFDLRDGNTDLLYEFPLYQWTIAQINKLFSYSVANSRIFTFIIFIAFLVAFFLMLRLFVDEKIALITNALLCFSPLLYYYCVNPMPDMMALAFSAWSLYFFFQFQKNHIFSRYILFAVFICLAALVKLPYLLFAAVVIPSVFSQITRGNFKPALKKIILLLVFLSPALAWYIHVIPSWINNPVVKGITANEKPFFQLLDYFQFTILSSVPELLTNYASCFFLLTGIFLFIKQFKSNVKKYPEFFLLFLAASAYYLFEMNAIEKTHDYYLMPFIPLLFLVVSTGVKFVYNNKWKWFCYLALALVPLTAWLRINHRWDPEKPGFVKDYLNKQDHFRQLIPENAKCIIDYDESRFISLYYLKRYGFSLYENEINGENLKLFNEQGASYLVSENANFRKEDFPGFEFEEIYSGELRIFKLSKR